MKTIASGFVYSGPYNPAGLLEGTPLVDLLCVDDVPPQLGLIRVGDACARKGLATAEAMARVICAAGGLTFYRGNGDALFVNPAAFGAAVDFARSTGALS